MLKNLILLDFEVDFKDSTDSKVFNDFNAIKVFKGVGGGLIERGVDARLALDSQPVRDYPDDEIVSVKLSIQPVRP